MKYIITLLIIIVSKNSFACSFKQLTEDELFEVSSRIFRAKIVSTEVGIEEMGGREFDIVLAKYKLLESYKGTNPEDGLVKTPTYGPGNCSIAMLAGTEYVIYLTDNDYVTIPTGSWWYFNVEGTDVKPKLEALRDRAKKNM